MNDHYLRYLQREHARLEAEIREEEKRPLPRRLLIARLKKLKLAVKDQMAACAAQSPGRQAAWRGRAGRSEPWAAARAGAARVERAPAAQSLGC